MCADSETHLSLHRQDQGIPVRTRTYPDLLKSTREVQNDRLKNMTQFNA